MNCAHDTDADFGPDDRAEDGALEARLRDERPTPRPAFRDDLRRRLLDLDVAPGPRFTIAVCAGGGTLLLAAAALGVAGVGPLAS